MQVTETSASGFEEQAAQDFSALNAEQQAMVEKHFSDLKTKLDAEGPIANYKLQVVLLRPRRWHVPYPGMLAFWHSGKKVHEGGDIKIYLCPGKYKGVNECVSPLFESETPDGERLCPSCGMKWSRDEVLGEVFFRLPAQLWAKVIHKYYTLFDMNADIFLVHQEGNWLKAQEQEKEKYKGGENYTKIRNTTKKMVYRLKNIIKDASKGSDVEKLFYRFITS